MPRSRRCKSGCQGANRVAHHGQVRLVDVGRFHDEVEPADREIEALGDSLHQVGELDEVAVSLGAEVDRVGVDDCCELPVRIQKSSRLTHGI